MRGADRRRIGRRAVLASGLAALVAGCSAPRVWAPDDVVARMAYRHDGPPALTLFTMVSNKDDSGAHTSLMINASQRVIFDPAGSLNHRLLPERHDVLYGVTPRVAEFYARAHARSTYHAVIQRREVSAEVAEQAFELAKRAGPVPRAQCTLSVARLLRQLPGFETIRPVLFPTKLSLQFGALPGTLTTRLFEDDHPDKARAVAAFDAALAGDFGAEP